MSSSNASRARTRDRVFTALMGSAAALAIASLATAHVDDPKEKDRGKPYVGPGWTYGQGADSDPGFPAQGVSLRAWIPIGDFGSFGYMSDCWGYTSPSGREYALVGLNSATGFVEITDPGNPVIVDVVAGYDSTWHDIKVYQSFAYSVTENSSSGIQIFDLSDIDNGNVNLIGTVGTGATHNVVIDPVKGHLYRTGGMHDGIGIYDLTVDPTNPPLVGEWATRYVHDAQVVTYPAGHPLEGMTVAFCCAGANGGWVDTGLTVLNVTDPGNIGIALDITSYDNPAYSHQLWLSPDLHYAYLNDEADEDGTFPSTTIVFDVSDPTDCHVVGTATNGNQAITHNLYVRDDNLMFAANYTSGLRVFDNSDPENPVEVGYFDTYPESDTDSFNGMWSNYPLFPSGTVIGSDTVRGLFVMIVENPYVDFTFPDGLPEMLSPSGDTIAVQIDELETGGIVPGSETFHYSSDGEAYLTTTMTGMGGGLYEATVPPSDCGSALKFYFSVDTPGGLRTSPATAPVSVYSALVADDLQIVLNDDSETDPGYTVQNFDLLDGAWERGVPAGDGTRGDPTIDADGSGAAWLTANRDGNSDVDGGPTELTTPLLDMSALDEPLVSYARWFTNDDLDDTLDVSISNDGGASWMLIESVAANPGSPLIGEWITHEFLVSDFVAPTDQMQLRFSAADQPNNSVTEAGIDSVRVMSFTCGACSEDPDTNGDGVVDVQDLLNVLSDWNCEGEPGSCLGDTNCDGVTSVTDLLNVLANWS